MHIFRRKFTYKIDPPAFIIEKGKMYITKLRFTSTTTNYKE